MLISAYGIAMGVKQRRYPYEACLKSLATFCDEIIVAYDKRFDNPVIFSRISDKIKLLEVHYEFDKWDFINTVLTQARRECKGEWCYIYGMDEVFKETQTVNLINAAKTWDANQNAITVRMICMLCFDMLDISQFTRGDGRVGLSRNLPNIIHKTCPPFIGQMDSEIWDGKYIKQGDDFGYLDELHPEIYWNGDSPNHFVEDYTIPEDIKGDLSKEINYRLENCTYIWHYAWYNPSRKQEQGIQTSIWQNRTYGRSADLDIEKQVQLLKETIILDPEYSHGIIDQVKQKPTWMQVNVEHPNYVREWIDEMGIGAI